MSEELKAAIERSENAAVRLFGIDEIGRRESAAYHRGRDDALEALARPTPIPVGETSEVERLARVINPGAWQLQDEGRPAKYTAEKITDSMEVAKRVATALSIRETQAPPAQGDGCIDGVKMPERIWLVWEGGEISWSADPDPSGLTTDAVEYTRAALSPATGQGGEA